MGPWAMGRASTLRLSWSLRMLACPSPLPCAARAAARRRRSAAAAAAAADEPSQQPAEPSGARKSYKNLTWAATRPIHDPLVDVDEEAHLISLGLGPSASGEEEGVTHWRRPELQWLPEGVAASACRDHVGVPSFDLLSLDYDKLLQEVTLSDDEVAELRRLSSRYFQDRVLDRAQVLERCRRIYEMAPFDPRRPGLETEQLLLSFQQLNENQFAITRWVAARAVDVDWALGQLVGATPGTVLPDATDIAIADIALFIEFQRELFLQSIKERQMVEEQRRAAAGELWVKAQERMALMAETALREGLGMEDMLVLGLEREHLISGIARIGGEATLPFSIEEYEERLAAMPFGGGAVGRSERTLPSDFRLGLAA